MSEGILEWECARCHLVQFFYIEDVAPDWSVGIRGGFAATLMTADEAYPTDWHGDPKCLCKFTDPEREALEHYVAEDYERGYEPFGLP
jgi:hypothetical protein